MPENKLPQPRNFLELINQNVLIANQNISTVINMLAEISKETADMRKEIAELRAMFNNPPAPEQPNAVSGSEGTVTE